MKERPILFAGPMVRAILAGTKTQTRRLAKTSREFLPWGVTIAEAYDVTEGAEAGTYGFLVAGDHGFTDPVRCPYGVPGDRLWVRETYAVCSVDGRSAGIARAERMPQGKTLADTDGGLDPYRDLTEEQAAWAHARVDAERWRPSIYMPRWASRITLEVTDVRVQRLQEISEEDAKAEGVFPPTWETDGLCFSRDHQHTDAGNAFVCLWNSTNAKRAPWDSNPFVWCVSFRRL